MHGGHRGTAQTIAAMRPLIDQGIKNQNINRLAIQIVRSTPEFSEGPKVQAIFNWMRQNIRFVADPVGKEALRTPEETLLVGAGDCDCMTVLIATIAGTIGLPSRAMTVSTDPAEPNTYSHVYPEVLADGEWIAVDCARPDAQLGLSPNHYFLKKQWDLFGTGSRQVNGLSGYLGCPATPGMGRGRLGGVPIHLAGVPIHLAAYRNAGRRRRAGMGDDDGFDIGDLTSILTPQLISSATSGAANIISAERASPYNLFPTTSPGVYSAAGLPAGYAYNSQGQLVAQASLTTGGISGTLVLGALAIAALFVVMR